MSKILINQTSNGESAPFQMNTGGPACLVMSGSFGTATVTLVLAASEEGPFVPPLDNAVAVGSFTAPGVAAVQHVARGLWGKVTVTGAGGGTNVNVDYVS